MRFELCQKIPVVSFRVHYHDQIGELFNTTFFFPWEVTVLSSEIVLLEVVEHHKVPYRYDPKMEKTCDGYVLKDESGGVWHNQYPMAYYGQLDDSYDRLFTRSPENPRQPRFTSLTDYMAGLLRGVYQLSKDPEKGKALQEVYDDLKTKFEKQTNSVITSKPTTTICNGVEKVLEGWFDVDITIVETVP